MRKKSNVVKRDVVSDVKHSRTDVSRFINYLMVDGKKSIAEKVVYDALQRIKEITKEEPISVFEKGIENATPLLEIVSKRIGGANYQIPREVRPERKFFLATHWIINAARGKKGKPMADRLADELIAASKNEGVAIKKKQDTHRMAEANRAFASLIRSGS
jgi:small subunit ribosomal protein S7